MGVNSLAMACQSAKGSGGTSSANTLKLGVMVSPPSSSQPNSRILLALADDVCLVHSHPDYAKCLWGVTAAKQFFFFMFNCVCWGGGGGEGEGRV